MDWPPAPVRLEDRKETGLPFAKSHREIFESLRKEGIGVNLHYIPVYHQPDFGKLEIQKSNYPQAEAYYKEAITLPLYPGMTEFEQKKVISALQNTIQRGT